MKWNLNDVSYLFPLPKKHNAFSAELLTPESQSSSGKLLPEEIYQQLPTLLINGNGNETLYHNALRVVAARIDPCPQLDSASCTPEVRMVWQPVEYDKYHNNWTARDAAIHCFYRLSEEEFLLLTKELWRIKVELAEKGIDTTKQPLHIHPAFENADTSKTFTNAIQQALLQYAGTSNLEKVTFISLMTPKRWWRFGAFEKDNTGQWQFIDIPRLDFPTVDIFNVAVEDGIGLGTTKGIDAIFNTFPDEYPETDNLFSVINKSYRFNDNRDEKVFKEKLNTIARFQNPHSTNTENLDCASCHYADATREYISNRFPELNSPTNQSAFVNPDQKIFDLENLTPVSKSGRNVRAFGFFNDQPVISQRTINESAVTANWLNQYYAETAPILLADSMNN